MRPPKPLQHTRTRWDKNSSQADSAGSIPVTRSIREKCCSRTELEDSRSLPLCVSGSGTGHCGPHLSTPRDPPSGSEDAQLVSSCSPAGSPVLQHHPRGVSASTRSMCTGSRTAQRRNATSDPMHAPALDAAMPVELTMGNHYKPLGKPMVRSPGSKFTHCQVRSALRSALPAPWSPTAFAA